MDVTPVARFCVYPICDATLQPHIHSPACMGGTIYKSLWAPPRTTKEHCVTTCHAETSQKKKTTSVFFQKVAILELDALERCFSKRLNVQG